MAENKIREPKPAPVVAEEVTPMVTDTTEPKKKPAPKKEKQVEKPKKEKAPKEKKGPHEKDPRYGYVAGFLLLCLSVFLSLAFISFFVSYFSGSYHETETVIFNRSRNLGPGGGLLGYGHKSGVFLMNN